MNESKCSRCGRYIVWARMPSGKWCPFVKVTVYTMASGNAQKFEMTSTVPGEDVAAIPFYISHYVDCPNSGEFGKGSVIHPNPGPSIDVPPPPGIPKNPSGKIQT